MENRIRLSFFHKKTLTYGVSYAGFSTFDSVILKNLTQESFTNLRVSVRAVPEIFLASETTVPFLAPGAFRVLSGAFLEVDPAKLLNPRESCSVRLEMNVTDENGDLVAYRESSVQLLPYTQFAGFRTFPESLAFFISPAQKEVREFAALLGEEKGIGPVRALYERFKEMQFTYSAENYFESSPCRLRFPEEVLRRRAGNSLELCVLFASVMEARGERCSVIAAPKGKTLVAVEVARHDLPAVSVFTKEHKDLSGYLFLDGNYLAYGSEWTFDRALYESRNFLEMTDETVFVFSLPAARRLHLVPLPCRLEGSDQAELDLSGEGESEGKFSEYYDLLQRYSGDERITAILTGKKLSVSAGKAAPAFDPALDVNQNKLLGRVLHSDFTLIRAQHTAGATALFARAAYAAVKAKKNVLYVTDPRCDSGDFAKACAEIFDPAFLLDLTRTSPDSLTDVASIPFTGIFADHASVFDEKDAVRSAYDAMDRYYASLEGGKAVASSFLSAADRYHQFRQASDQLVFAPEQIGVLSDDMVQTWFSTVSEAVSSAEEAGGVYENPLDFVRRRDFSYEFKSRLISQLEDLLRAAETLLEARGRVASQMKTLPELNTAGKTQAFCDLSRLFLSFDSIPTTFFEDQEAIEGHFKTLTRLLQAKTENDQVEDLISISFEPSIFSIPAEETCRSWKEVSEDKSFKGISAKHALQKSVKHYLKPNCDVENIGYVLSRLEAYQKNKAFLQEKKDWAFSLIGISPDEKDRGWTALKEKSDLCYQAYAIFNGAFAGESIGPLVSELALLSRTEGFPALCAALQNAFADYLSAKRPFEITAQNDLDPYAARFAAGKDYFPALYTRLTALLSSMNRLNAWCDWLLKRDKCTQIGLKNVVLALETGRVKPGEMKKAFIRAFFKAICEFNFISHPELVPGAFDFEEKRALIAEMSAKLARTQKAELDSMLSVEKLNAKSEVEPGSDLAAVIGNAAQFRALWPVVVADVKTARRLFEAKKDFFELILVENRGKIRLADFLWMLSSSRHLAYAGNFARGYRGAKKEFDLSDSAFDFLWQITEEKYSLSAVYASDPAITAIRSAVAGARYPDTRCYTAPAPDRRKRASLLPVRGFFGREIPGVNPEEGEAVIGELLRRAEELSGRSVSVVCATREQKEWIVRTLARRLYERKDLASLLLGGKEKLYVAALGEELRRADVIYFSTAYAVDRGTYGSRLPHAFSEAFGTDPKTVLSDVLALAREEFTLVTSFSDEDLSSSASVPETDLSFRLLFALLEEEPVNATWEVEDPVPGSSFVKRLASQLFERGHRVECGVRSGRYFLDLAVKNEEGDFVLGIIADPSVMSQKANISAIEMQNEAQFSAQGWRLFRLRTPECFDRFDRELEKVLAILEPGEKKDWEA